MRFDHVGLSVADLDAMTSWWCAALGLEVEFDFALEAVDLRGAMLLGPDGWRLELLHRVGNAAGLQAANPAEAALTRGYGHLALDVPDVDAAYADLLAAGASDRMTPRPSPEPGVRMAFVADPEGNLVELLDRTTSREGGFETVASATSSTTDSAPVVEEGALAPVSKPPTGVAPVGEPS
ncbi:VOC family protein [Nocardioides luti]|nr:VOC family protein [Nocardioides luti]